MQLRTQDVTYQVQDKVIIDRISLYTKEKGFVGLLGPNGSGKSTFLKTIYRVLKPQTGSIQLDHHDILKIPLNELAKQMAAVIQEPIHETEFTVEEVILMGRYPFKSLLDKENTNDYQIVENALNQVGLWNMRGQLFTTLSGGEKQRTLIARALAQTPRFLILDEPTNHLDIHHQLEVLDLLKRLETGVLVTLHDLNLAAHYCDYLFLLQAGRIVCHGTPEEVLTQDTIRAVYQVESEVMRHPITGKLHIHYFPP